MNNIAIITRDIDVSAIVKEINSQPENWLLDTKRQDRLYEQTNTETINLVKAWSPTPLADHRNNHQYKPTNLYDLYPETMKAVNRYFPAGISRVAIVKLKPGKQVFPHVDDGEYYKARHRYHLAITGSYLYTVEDDRRQINPGTLMWFNNKRVHSSYNNTAEDRVSVIFDVEI
jgi:hypothetical protein